MRRCVIAVLVALCWLHPLSSAEAQDACSQAAIHVADCQTHFCPISESSEACQTSLQSLTEQLAAVCDVELAQHVLLSSCAGLAGDTGGGGDPCQLMAERMRDCVEQICLVPEPPPVCEFFVSLLDEPMPDGECPEELAEIVEEMLEQSCEELLGI